MTAIKVLAFGAWDRGPGYPRGTSLLDGLRSRSIDVVECRFELPYQGAAKRSLLAAPWLWPGYLMSMRRVRREAKVQLQAAIATANPDAVLVPYPGHLVVSWARDVWTGPLILDLFLSAYDTAVLDRRMFREGSLMARWMRRMDRRACVAADRVLLDTEQNLKFVASLVDLPRNRFAAVPVSDPEAPGVAPA